MVGELKGKWAIQFLHFLKGTGTVNKTLSSKRGKTEVQFCESRSTNADYLQ